MRNDILIKLLFTKIMLLLTPCYKRQRYINDLVMKMLKYKSEFEFNMEEINELIEMKETLSLKEQEKLFSERFNEYNLFKFGKTRLYVDNFHPEDCRTFAQFNESLKVLLLLSDYEESLNNQ